MKKIVVCPDSFKGSMKAGEISRLISEVIKEELPEADIVELPLADGGEGTADVLMDSYPLYLSVKARDPLGRERKAHYYTDLTGKKGFIETADVIGLPLLKEEERNPMEASSYGVGEVIADAIKHGFEEVTVALGGSATCDGGMGMMEALGFKFLDGNGDILEGRGKNLSLIREIDANGMNEGLKKIKIKILHDVLNPLTGEWGAAKVYGRQKGATEEEISMLEEGLRKLVEVSEKAGFKKKEKEEKHPWEREGSGAAGGLGYAFMSYMKIEMEPGIDFVLREMNFEERIQWADLIITGEGKLDSQSIMGKVLSGVLREGKRKDIPVVSISCQAEDKPTLKAAGLTESYILSEYKGKEKSCKMLSREEIREGLKEAIREIIKKLP